MRRGAYPLVSVNVLPAVKTGAVVKHETAAFPQGLRDAPLCGVVGLSGGGFLSITRLSLCKKAPVARDVWFVRQRHSPGWSDAGSRPLRPLKKNQRRRKGETKPQPLRGISGV